MAWTKNMQAKTPAFPALSKGRGLLRPDGDGFAFWRLSCPPWLET
jgi:hypothetical protein